MNQFIIKTPEGEDLNLLPANIKTAINNAKGQFPHGVLVGSKPVFGYELRLVMCNLELVDFERVIIELGLGWEIIASQNIVINQDKIIPYMVNLPVYDSEGDFLNTVPVTDLTGKIQTYSGKNWTY